MSTETQPKPDLPAQSLVRLQGSFFDRTMLRIVNLWRDMTDSVTGTVDAALSDEGDLERLREQMAACLDGRGGEVSARARAASLGRTYLGLDNVGRERFLRLLAGGFDVDRAGIDRAIEAVRSAPAEGRSRAEAVLRDALEPPRMKLLTQFNALPEGVKFLVDMRASLLPIAREDAEMAALVHDLQRLLSSWFDIGFLELRRITWNAPALLLEKLIAYEAVHHIRSWDDLKNRLDSDRRCFAFFHPRMPDEPLIFVEVALVQGLAGNVAELLDESAPLTDPADEADTAIFYSISNAQKGLAGISFGGFLIKRVVDVLAAELPGLKTFSTLSPIPGFRRWLDKRMESGGPLLTPPESAVLFEVTGIDDDQHALRQALSSDTWHEDARLSAALQRPLERLCAHYLVNEKRSRGRALDPVAHFHLTNGARVGRLNWLADLSGNGLSQSAGIMVNYLYELDWIESNHEAYTGDATVTASAAVNRLLKT